MNADKTREYQDDERRVHSEMLDSFENPESGLSALKNGEKFTVWICRG